jgi:hypothetical protein
MVPKFYTVMVPKFYTVMVPKSYAELRDESAETRANLLQHWLAGSKDAFVKTPYLTNCAKA